MGITKSNLFTDEQNELAQIAKVFAHPARIAIVQYLIKANACINGDLVEELGLAQATISQHLRELKEIGIIQGTIEGSKINYCINQNTWKAVEKQFQEFFNTFNSRPSCC